MDRDKPEPRATLVDAPSLAGGADARGVRWGGASEDLNVTLLSWPAGDGVAPHVNNEVDVALIAVSGAGEIVVDGEPFTVAAGQALLIPKGRERAIRAVSERFSYLSVHRRRPGLMPTVRGKPVRP